ncbi:MAG: PIN domain-containing protein [Gaiellaceae bacterium]
MAEHGPGVVLDASAVIALLEDEPGADAVEALLRSERARMSTVNVAEVVDVLVRVHGGDPDEVIARIEELFEAPVEATAPSFDHAIRAGQLRARIFDRRERRVSLADCFVLATAEPGDRIATTDGALADMARDEGFDVVVS